MINKYIYIWFDELHSIPTQEDDLAIHNHGSLIQNGGSEMNQHQM